MRRTKPGSVTILVKHETYTLYTLYSRWLLKLYNSPTPPLTHTPTQSYTCTHTHTLLVVRSGQKAWRGWQNRPEAERSQTLNTYRLSFPGGLATADALDCYPPPLCLYTQGNAWSLLVTMTTMQASSNNNSISINAGSGQASHVEYVHLNVVSCVNTEWEIKIASDRKFNNIWPLFLRPESLSDPWLLLIFIHLSHHFPGQIKPQDSDNMESPPVRKNLTVPCMKWLNKILGWRQGALGFLNLFGES